MSRKMPSDSGSRAVRWVRRPRCAISSLLFFKAGSCDACGKNESHLSSSVHHAPVCWSHQHGAALSRGLNPPQEHQKVTKCCCLSAFLEWSAERVSCGLIFSLSVPAVSQACYNDDGSTTFFTQKLCKKWRSRVSRNFMDWLLNLLTIRTWLMLKNDTIYSKAHHTTLLIHNSFFILLAWPIIATKSKYILDLSRKMK